MFVMKWHHSAKVVLHEFDLNLQSKKTCNAGISKMVIFSALSRDEIVTDVTDNKMQEVILFRKPLQALQTIITFK